MATPNYWIGIQDYNVAGNWSAGNVPTSGDHAIYSGGHSQADCMVNIALGQAGPSKLTVMDDYYGSIGGPGNYLTNLVSNTTHVIIRGHGDYYLSPQWVGGYTLIDTKAGVTHLKNNLLQVLEVKAGQVVIDGSSGIQSGGYVHTWTERAHLVIEASAVANYANVFECYGGTIVNKNAVDPSNRVHIIVGAGGDFRQEGLLDTSTWISVYGGIFRYAPNADPSAQAPYFYVNGILDISESDYVIPVGRIIIGPRGEIRGSALEILGATLDLRQDYP